jgi:hypothetical protein
LTGSLFFKCRQQPRFDGGIKKLHAQKGKPITHKKPQPGYSDGTPERNQVSDTHVLNLIFVVIVQAAISINLRLLSLFKNRVFTLIYQVTLFENDYQNNGRSHCRPFRRQVKKGGRDGNASIL